MASCKNKSSPLSVENFVAELDASSAKFVAMLYSNRQIPRNAVQTILDNYNSYLQENFMLIFKSKIKNTLEILKCPASIQSELDIMVECLVKPFEKLNTQYKRIKFFKEATCYIEPQSYLIDKTFGPKTVHGALLGKNLEITGQMILLRKSLKLFFELPNALQETLRYMESLRNNPYGISNFIQSRLWCFKTAKYAQSRDILMPLFIFTDDVQVNKALGPHSNKLCAVYASLPSLPPECRALLKNIFLVALFESWCREKLEKGNQKVFKPVIEELKFLEEDGIIINTLLGVRKIRFITGLLLGDNLGLNNVLGMVGSFSAKYFCRFCKVTKSDSEKVATGCTENPALLRDPQNYEDDLKTNNASETGIKEECVYNEIPSFHMTTNYSVDEMHDMREGVGNYAMTHIMKGITAQKTGVIDLDTLNHRLNMFDYGPIDGQNKLTTITKQALDAGKIKSTAEEMSRLVKLFGLIIGDKIPEDNNYWKLYLSLRRVMDIISAKQVPKDTSKLLKSLIERNI